MNIEKTFFIDGIDLTVINGSNYVPTALCYKDKKIIYGHEAFGLSQKKHIVNGNFKIDLGEYTINVLKNENKKFETESAGDKSAFELTNDFFKSVLKNVEEKIGDKREIESSLKILVAEPLSFKLESRSANWVKNYRDNIKRILHKYECVDFLPEPFAVYQFYRYGLRIPQLQNRSKQVAFIIDFGGGTIDISIIESTVTGDISLTGKHSKPLAASSEPIGGFFINQKLGEYLIKRGLEDRDKRKADQLIKTYHRVMKGEVGYESLNHEKKSFINNLRTLVSDVESIKIELCNKISSWDLEVDCYDKVFVDIKKNPFSDADGSFTITLYGHEFRTLFISEVWNKHIKVAIKSAITRAKESLKGKEITATLISGGSSNIRWVEKLLVRDFADEIGHAKPVPLSSSFHEIVSKGLAIECARRFYEPDSEFVSVTYNPVRLLLNPDGKGLEQKRFSSVENKIDMSSAIDGDLLPSAQALKNFIDEPLQWKVRLKGAPKNYLEYYFMRPSSADLVSQPNDYENLYNIDKKVYTSPDVQFDAKVRIELTVREDGTALPRFIYKTGNVDHGISESFEKGTPFVLDMTAPFEDVGSSQYIGFDFGTSNTSLCYLTNDHISTLETRSKDVAWLELKDLIPKLPYPISFPLRKYLSVNNADRSVENARDAFEALLAFATFVAVSELDSMGLLGTRMKIFSHRSMGPLKDLLERCLVDLGDNAIFSNPWKKLFSEFSSELITAIQQFTDHKHNKISSDLVNCHAPLMILSNLCHEVMIDTVFGFFEESKPERFKNGIYNGLFRVAHDSQPFVESFKTTTCKAFDLSIPMILKKKSGQAISLFPLYFCEEDSKVGEPYSIYVFDKSVKGNYVYKSVSKNISLSTEGAYEGLKHYIDNLYDENISSEILNLKLNSL